MIKGLSSQLSGYSPAMHPVFKGFPIYNVWELVSIRELARRIKKNAMTARRYALKHPGCFVYLNNREMIDTRFADALQVKFDGGMKEAIKLVGRCPLTNFESNYISFTPSELWETAHRLAGQEGLSISLSVVNFGADGWLDHFKGPTETVYHYWHGEKCFCKARVFGEKPLNTWRNQTTGDISFMQMWVRRGEKLFTYHISVGEDIDDEPCLSVNDKISEDHKIPKDTFNYFWNLFLNEEEKFLTMLAQEEEPRPCNYAYL